MIFVTDLAQMKSLFFTIFTIILPLLCLMCKAMKDLAKVCWRALYSKNPTKMVRKEVPGPLILREEQDGRATETDALSQWASLSPRPAVALWGLYAP